MAENFQFRAGQDLLGDLLKRVRALEAASDVASPWSPQIISSGTSPTYSDGSLQGFYLRRKDWVFAQFQAVLSGWVGGSGVYALRTPWPPNLLVPANQGAGQWWALGSGGTATSQGAFVSVSSAVPNNSGDWWFATKDGATIISPTVPFTWADGDMITGIISFQVSPGY